LLLLVILTAVPVGLATGVGDDDDKDPSIRPGIRRLHPERERAKAIKKLQEQMSQKADPNADPWDTADDLWGTVDLPPKTDRDSAAVVGRRLTSVADEQEESKRMAWRDEPVTQSLDQLMLFMTVDGSEYRSQYVSSDSVGNEAYFAFDLEEDSLPGPLRLCLRYAADSPCNYDQVTFTIDGCDYIFYPAEPRNGKTSGGMYWTASDDELHAAYKDLVYALAHGSWAMIKLHGPSGVNRVKVINDGQLSDFANTLALYRLMGGTFNH
jgi:hypothetical protein